MDEKFKTLTSGEVCTEYTIKSIETHGDFEMKNFLLSLGCYEGQKITIISALPKSYIVSVKDARYSIDDDLARAILI